MKDVLLEDASNDIERLENEASVLLDRIAELEGQLYVYTKPEVAVKDIQDEIRKIKNKRNEIPAEAKEHGKKRSEEFVNEIDNIIALRDAPPSKILKVAPAPRSIPLLPVTSKKGKKKKNRESRTKPSTEPSVPVPKVPSVPEPSTPSPEPRVSVPEPSVPEPTNKNLLKRERSASPPPAPQLPAVSPKKRKKEKG